MKVTKKTKRFNMDSLIDGLISYMREYSRFMIRWGETEKKYGNILKNFEERTRTPKFMNKMVEKLSPQAAGLLVKVFMRLSTITPKMKDFLKLPPDEKILVGKDLEKIVEDFEKLLKQLDSEKLD